MQPPPLPQVELGAGGEVGDELLAVVVVVAEILTATLTVVESLEFVQVK